MTERTLKIIAIADETPLIRRIVLADPNGGLLPEYAAGAHITIAVPDVGARKYSLVNASAADGGTRAPRAYILGIRRDDGGEGGSRFMHSLAVGHSVQVSGPDNNFALQAGTAPVLLLGGGIGITPLITMAAELAGQGRPFRLVYAAKSRADMAFLPEIEALAGGNLLLHADETQGRILDAHATLAALEPDVTVYACGPKPMLRAAMAASRQLKWAPNRLKFELFYSVAKPGA